ncbi:MAG: hypothetical protein GY731_15935, partial [Gammaproteobacteria bacterium]|nr:hypothetical protein [Gammaproteobacteria bacterium]
MGLGLYEVEVTVQDPATGQDVIQKQKRLVVIGGGGLANGFIKILDISNLFIPGAATTVRKVKSQVISDTLGDAGGRVNGTPRSLKILDHYAFVAVFGGGMVMIDLEQMDYSSTGESIIGVWDKDQLINTVDAFTLTCKDAEDPEAPEITRVFVVMLIDYYGIRILDVTDPDKPVEWAHYNVTQYRGHYSGLAVSKDYWVDIDKDGRQGAAEDNDKIRDMEDSDKNIMAEDESNGLL